MRLRILQRLPGTISAGALPAGEDYEAGRDYEVEETLAATMKRSGWAVDAASSPAPLFGRDEEHAS